MKPTTPVQMNLCRGALALVVLLLAIGLSAPESSPRPASAAAGAPMIELGPPYTFARSVHINGITLPGGGGTITRIFWDWGDGTGKDSWFPALHAYARPGTYQVRVTSYQDDGQWASAQVNVRIPRLPAKVIVPGVAHNDSAPPPVLAAPQSPSAVKATLIEWNAQSCQVTVDVTWQDNSGLEDGFIVGSPSTPQMWPWSAGYIRVPRDATAARFTVRGSSLFPVFVFAIRQSRGVTVFSEVGPPGHSGIFLELPECENR